MSISDHSSNKEAKFALQTRLVIYNFLGLVPTQEVEDEGLLTTTNIVENQGRSSDETSWNLSSLPPVSLIQKLKDSEEHFAKNRLVCDELVKKVEKFIPNSPSIEKQRKSKLCQEDLHKSLLQEIQLRGSTKSNCSGSTEERLFVDSTNIRQMTVIKKRENLKVIFDSSKLYTHDGSQPSNSPQVDKNSNPLSDFDDRSSFEQNSGEILTENMIEYDGCSDAHVSEARQQTSGHHIVSPGSYRSKRSYARQVSGVSSSSRRCSTYVDINDVDDTTLASYKRLPPSTLPLKRELSKAISQLESDYNQMNRMNNDTEEDNMTTSPGLFSSVSLVSPESHVADRLRAIGDQLNAELGPRMDQIIGQMVEEFCARGGLFSSVYMNTFGPLFSEIASGWNRVALTLTALQRVVIRLIEMGSPQVSEVVELMATLLEEQNRDFIIDSGGWNTVSDTDMIETSLPLNITEELGFDITNDANVSTVQNMNHPGGDNIADKSNGGSNYVESPSGETTASQSSINSQLFSSALNLDPSPTDKIIDNRDGRRSTDDIFSTPLRPGSEEPYKKESSDEGLPDTSDSSETLLPFGKMKEFDEEKSKNASKNEKEKLPNSQESRVDSRLQNNQSMENDNPGNSDWSRDVIAAIMERFSSQRVRNLVGFSVVVGSLLVLWKVLRRS